MLPESAPRLIPTTFATAPRKLEHLTLEDLLFRFKSTASRRQSKPRSRATTSRTFERDAVVAAIARRRASFRCEVPQCAYVPFQTPDGSIYSEVHHIVRLAEGGSDTPENVVCLCPSHHREAHHGKHATELRHLLLQLRTK